MKSLFRFVVLVLMISGWLLAGLCLHVVRTRDLNDPKQSKLVVFPKERLGISDTYVDARNWTMADVPAHGVLVLRMIDIGKADQLAYLADPKSGKSVRAQLLQALDEADDSALEQSGSEQTSTGTAATQAADSTRPATRAAHAAHAGQGPTPAPY